MDENRYEYFAAGYALADAQINAKGAQSKVEIAYEVWKEARKKQLVTEILEATGAAPFVSEGTYFRVARLVELFANGLEYANKMLIKL